MELRVGPKGIRQNLEAMQWAIKNAPMSYMATLVDSKCILENLFVEQGLIGPKEIEQLNKEIENDTF